MTREVFFNDHLEGLYESIRADRRKAEADLESAKLREALVDVIEVGGNALHVIFRAGGEPKWRVPEEREQLVQLSNALRIALRVATGKPS